MGVSLLATNYKALVGKWNPFIHKMFYLGRAGVINSSDDSNVYILQINGSSALELGAYIDNSFNAGATYDIIFGTSDKFYVRKTFQGVLDNIYASETGGSDDGKWWEPKTGDKIFPIDVGIYVQLPDVSSSHFDDGDIYRKTTPSSDFMDRRKIYHGGYSTYMRIPETEGKAYHSEIIPTDLKGRNITVLFGRPVGEKGTGLEVCLSNEDILGNSAVSLSLEWNVNPDAANSSTAGATTYAWGSGEKWQLGTVFANDINPNISADVPVFSSFPSSDATPVASTTGTFQTLNTQVSGRAGHARIRTEYWAGAGTPTVIAHNQFWPVTLTIG